MNQLRTYYWYLSAFLRKHGALVVGTVVAGILVFSFFIPVIARQFEGKPKTYLGMVGSYSLDNLPTTVQHQLSLGLTKIAEDGTVSPELASRWSVEDDNRQYRFIIRDNVVWQDGKSLLPQDIEYRFPEVDVLTTEHDIVFKLPDSFVPFPTTVARPLFRYGEEKKWFFLKRKTVIGLGQYRLVDYKEQGPRVTEVQLESSKERLIYRFYLTEAEAITAYKLGKVDKLTELTSPGELADWKNVKVTSNIQYDRYQAIFFNLSNPLFQKNIRQAFAYALPKPTGSERATGPINPKSWAYLAGGKEYEYDLNRAVERMLSKLPEQPLQFELTTTQSFADQAEEIKKSWEELGQLSFEACQQEKTVEDKSKCELVKPQITVKISNFPDTSNFQVLLVGQIAPPDPDQYPLWHSEQPTNFTHYKNTRIDSLLEKGRQVSDRQERLAIYQEFQQFFLEDTPAIFVKHLVNYTIERK
jgi:peptide/nickel transport system substrate-binding protein